MPRQLVPDFLVLDRISIKLQHRLPLAIRSQRQADAPILRTSTLRGIIELQLVQLRHGKQPLDDGAVVGEWKEVLARRKDQRPAFFSDVTIELSPSLIRHIARRDISNHDEIVPVERSRLRLGIQTLCGQLAWEERVGQHTQIGLVKDHDIQLDVLIARQGRMQVSKLPAAFALDQQDIGPVVNHLQSELARVVVRFRFLGQFFRSHAIPLATFVLGGQVELDFLTRVLGDDCFANWLSDREPVGVKFVEEDRDLLTIKARCPNRRFEDRLVILEDCRRVVDIGDRQVFGASFRPHQHRINRSPTGEPLDVVGVIGMSVISTIRQQNYARQLQPLALGRSSGHHLHEVSLAPLHRVAGRLQRAIQRLCIQ